MAKVTTFEVGYCTHPGCMALKGAGMRVCRFPARAWLLEAAGKRWLLDTGYAQHFYDHTQRGIISLYRKVTPVHFDSQDALVNQLGQIGILPSDIDGLIISHFHGDHIAGLRDFPAVDFICAADGWQQTRLLSGFAALKRAFVPGLLPEDFTARLRFIESFAPIAMPQELAELGVGYELPGSQGEIIIVLLPGHAAGHIGVCLLTDSGWLLLASDAAWSPTNYQQLRGPSTLAHIIMDDQQAYYQTLTKLNQLYLKGVAISLCHEGDLA